jgi:hypothetical protein
VDDEDSERYSSRRHGHIGEHRRNFRCFLRFGSHKGTNEFRVVEREKSLTYFIWKALFRKGKTLFLKIGEEDVEYDEHFRLYLQTKLSNPHYKPEISAQCTIINFIVTRKGEYITSHLE